MSYVIALAGKGGTGKTTIASLLVRALVRRNEGPVLAIDADPNSNLAESLGAEAGDTIGSILDEVCAHPDEVPAGMTKDRFIEYRIHHAIREEEGFDVLTMGKPEGPGCDCYVNNILRNLMISLIKDYRYVIIDNEAGLEHLSRRTTRSADTLLVVSDASIVGLKAARRIAALVQELKIKVKHKLLLVNRLEGAFEKQKAADLGLEFIGSIPSDNNITQLSLNGGALLGLGDDTLSVQAVKALEERIICQAN
ncbi:MAG: AAA family ATPase [Candidatus Omnitrophica bacterium]|nr:AAA family ATPase [Candidatus Omnitrophota bacterium]